MFNHDTAFCRNLGWVTDHEFEFLKTKRIAIGGCGGVGGVHLITLIRLGITKFNISDPDDFELQNFNRQYGADLESIGQNKTSVMIKKALLINPDLNINSFEDGISEDNLANFLTDVDIYVDGLDLFEIPIRELIFSECKKRNIPCIVVAPVGMGASLISFTQNSMSFENYFGTKNKSHIEKILRFSLGIAPSFIHLKSLVAKKYSNLLEKKISSTPMGCQLAAGVMGTEVLKTLLKRGRITEAPTVIHYDAYSYTLKKSTTYLGAHSPIFRLKLFVLKIILNSLNKNRQYS